MPEDPRNDGFFSGNGLLSRVSNFLQRADRASERGSHNLVSGLERLGQTGASSLGLGSVGDYLGAQAAENEAAAAAPVPGATDWQTVKAHPNVGNIASFIGESAGGAVPGLAAVAVNPLLFGASRAGDVAHIRAANNGGDAAGLGDVAAAAPSALLDTFLMRGGLNAMLKGSIGKAALREGLAQGGMPVADYAGETVGTNKPFDPMEAADRGVAGVVAGVPFGAAGAGYARLRSGRTAAPSPEDMLTEGSLNGEQPAWMQAPIAETLQSVGSDPSHFSTPERAARAAERVQTVRPQEPSSFDRQWSAIIGNEGGTGPHGEFRTSPKGAVGPAQVMPGTGPEAAQLAGLDWNEHLYRTDAGYNEAIGKAYYRQQLHTFGDPAKAAAAYNAGPGAVEGAIHKYGDGWLDHLPQETQNYVRGFADKIGSDRVFRAPPPTDDPFSSESTHERTDRPEEPLSREGAGESRTATGDNSRPFMDSTDDPEGAPGFWERRARMREEELHKEWEASRQSAGEATDDPSGKYGANNYGQRPHMDENGIFARTGEGHIADVNGKPVAFRNVKDAAKFAVKNKLAGDFEPHVWAANSARVVLTRRDGSSYGERPATPEGPAEPPAGRSDDESQRLISDWQKAPLASEIEPGSAQSEPPASGPARSATSGPEAPLRAQRGSETDRVVPRETENVPAGPERFEAEPPAKEGDLYPGGTFERPRPEADYGKEPPTPLNFLQNVADQLNARSKQTGLRHRISAENAIANGVDADAIFVNPKAKYPSVKAHLQRVFSSEKAPLRSKAQPVELHQVDDLGDRFDPQDYGILHGKRPTPEEIGQLLHDSIHGHDEALDRSDPNYEKRQEWMKHHAAAEEFASRYGRDWHKLPDEELARIDASEGEDARFDDALNHVLGNDHGRPAESEASDARGVGEDQGGNGRPSGDAREAGGRGAAAEDALIPPRAGDGRDALQRRADAGLKPDAEQKPAGSDGGLFDTQDTTGDLYGAKNKLVTRKAKDAAAKKISDASKRAHSGVDPEALGAFATEAGFHAEASARKLASMVLEPDADPGEIIRAARDMAKSPVKTTKGLLKALDRFGSAVAYSSDGALRTIARHYNSPTVVKLADMFQSRAGAADGTGETYDGALKRNNGRFRSRLDETLDPFIGNKASMERIRDLLTDPDRTVRSTDKERAAAREIRGLLKDVVDYRKEAGEEIGEVKDYFPRVVDSLAVANEPGKFKAAAERLYHDLGVDDPAAAADAWTQRILDTHAGLDGGEEFMVASGKPSSSKSREFGPAADRMLRDFMQKDPLLVLSDYITGSVRRAEQTRRFGPKGAENSKERGEWMKEHGSKTQWDVMLDKIREELRASGEDADGIVRQVKTIRDGNMGRLGTAGVRVSRAVSSIHAWNQLSTLQKVTLSSMGDLAMGFIAGKGGMGQGTRHFATSLKEAARLVETLGKRDLSDGHRWAEAIGVVGHGTASQLIQARMDAAPGAVRHAALLNKFYHKVGIEQLTQGGRVAAAENAKVFLDTLSGDMLSGSARTRQRAAFFLKELGVKEPAPFAEWVRNNGVPDRRAVQHASEGSREAEYAAAVVRFADQTILMPSRAMKPAWANHPVGSLLFALQSYNAAFTQNVLKRVGRLGVEAVKTKDPHLLVPALGLTVLVGMNALQDYLRKAVFGGANTDETEQQYAFRILDRAGLTGMASPLFNALFGLKYHRSVSQSLQGSVLGRAGQAIDAGGGLFIGNTDKTNTAERKAAGLLYDLVVDPTVNAFGAKYVRGAAGTAVIMGTGNKKGGALPGDRDAFVDAVAGPGKT